MGWQTVNAVLDHSRARSAALLVLICIAERAPDVTRACFPSREDIARRAKMNSEVVGRVISRLVEDGDLIAWIRPGTSTAYLVPCGMTEEEIAAAMFAAWGLTPEQLVAWNAEAGAKLRKSSGNLSTLRAGVNPSDRLRFEANPSSESQPSEPSHPSSGSRTTLLAGVGYPSSGARTEPNRTEIEPKKESTPAKPATPSARAKVKPPAAPRSPKPKSREPNPLTKHAAIQLVWKLTRYYPHASLYDDVIAALGDRPNEALAASLYKEWLSRGSNPRSLKPFLEWYPLGCAPPQVSRPALKTYQSKFAGVHANESAIAAGLDGL